MSRRAHFERRAQELSDCARLESWRGSGEALFIRIQPNNERAVGVVLYLGSMKPSEYGTVRYDDQGSVDAELGDDLTADLTPIDDFIDSAVAGRVTAYHQGKRGGCTEVVDSEGRMFRSWMSALPLPGWRRRWVKVEYEPHR